MKSVEHKGPTGQNRGIEVFSRSEMDPRERGTTRTFEIGPSFDFVSVPSSEWNKQKWSVPRNGRNGLHFTELLITKGIKLNFLNKVYPSI